MYNVLAKLRSGEPLTAKDKAQHEAGLVAVLRQLHDELDTAVLAAYGWQDLIADISAHAERIAKKNVPSLRRGDERAGMGTSRSSSAVSLLNRTQPRRSHRPHPLAPPPTSRTRLLRLTDKNRQKWICQTIRR